MIGQTYNWGWKLSEEDYIYFSEGKAFEPGKRFIVPLGSYTLRRINAILARTVRQIWKDERRWAYEEDSNVTGKQI